MFEEYLGKSIKYNKEDKKSKSLTIHLKGKFIYIDSENKKSIFINILEDGSLEPCTVVFVTNDKQSGYFGKVYYLNVRRIESTRIKKGTSKIIDTYIDKNKKETVKDKKPKEDNKNKKSSVKNIIQHTKLDEDLLEETMYGSCMWFANYLDTHIKGKNKGGVVAYVEREFVNGKDSKEGYAIERGLVVHVGYKLSNGQIIDALNIYKNDTVFENYVEKNYDIICGASYYEGNPKKILDIYPSLKEPYKKGLSKSAVKHADNLIKKINKKD